MPASRASAGAGSLVSVQRLFFLCEVSLASSPGGPTAKIRLSNRSYYHQSNKKWIHSLAHTCDAPRRPASRRGRASTECKVRVQAVLTVPQILFLFPSFGWNLFGVMRTTVKTQKATSEGVSRLFTSTNPSAGSTRTPKLSLQPRASRMKRLCAFETKPALL